MLPCPLLMRKRWPARRKSGQAGITDAMETTENKTTLFYPVINPLECKACGRCIAACPKKVLRMGEELNARGYTFALYAGEGCCGCCNCFYTCPEPAAIEVRKRTED